MIDYEYADHLLHRYGCTPQDYRGAVTPKTLPACLSGPTSGKTMLQALETQPDLAAEEVLSIPPSAEDLDRYKLLARGWPDRQIEDRERVHQRASSLVGALSALEIRLEQFDTVKADLPTVERWYGFLAECEIIAWGIGFHGLPFNPRLRKFVESLAEKLFCGQYSIPVFRKKPHHFAPAKMPPGSLWEVVLVRGGSSEKSLLYLTRETLEYLADSYEGAPCQLYYGGSRHLVNGVHQLLGGPPLANNVGRFRNVRGRSIGGRGNRDSRFELIAELVITDAGFRERLLSPDPPKLGFSLHSVHEVTLVRRPGAKGRFLRCLDRPTAVPPVAANLGPTPRRPAPRKTIARAKLKARAGLNRAEQEHHEENILTLV